MKKVLVFFNSQPVEVINTLKAINAIRREYPDGQEEHLRVRLAGIHSVSNRSVEIYIASDKELTPEEIINAANQFL
ncbi:hypothetical protein [Enterobacter sp.]|uniref:hypothetical protein n=1 Tax=Enterobacter sp. TaxID=42895 RepID=UPI00296E9B17|nr:hypothetical protein [Enterobacter sp.]